MEEEEEEEEEEVSPSVDGGKTPRHHHTLVSMHARTRHPGFVVGLGGPPEDEHGAGLPLLVPGQGDLIYTV